MTISDRPRAHGLGVRVLCLASLLCVAGAMLVTSGTSAAQQESAAAPALGEATIRARQHYFGLDNVNPSTGAVRRDRVIVSWTGEAGFAASFNGHVALLDSWISRRPGQGGISMSYVGSTPDELAALEPEMDFVGHFHHDHAGDLPTVIRKNPGLIVLGTQEHCNDITAEVTDVPFTCRAVFPAGSDYGDIAKLPHLIPGVHVTAVRHPHSGATPGEREIVPPENFMAEVQYPPAADEPTDWSGPTSGSIAILWQFRIGRFALVWHDTSGPADDATSQALRRLAKTDIEIGSIVSGGGNGVTDATRYINALAPKVFMQVHTDNYHNPAQTAYYRPILQQALAGLPSYRRPILRFLSDPGDYLRPLGFDPNAPGWR